MPLRRALAICACLCFLGYLASPLALPRLDLGNAELEALVFPISHAGSTGFDALVLLGQIVGVAGEMPPLMIRLFALCLLLVHGWLFWMLGCWVLGRGFPFSYWKRVFGLSLASVLLGALALAAPAMTGQFTAAALLPLGALGLLFASLGGRGKDPAPDTAHQSSPQTGKGEWGRWLAVLPTALVHGLLLTLGIHVVFAIGEWFLPRNVMDPPFLRLAGFAAPLLPERILLALLVPSALVLSGSSCAPGRRRALSLVLSLLVLGIVLGGGVWAGWTFGRVYVASLLEPAITVAGLVLAIALVWRREGRRAAAQSSKGSAT